MKEAGKDVVIYECDYSFANEAFERCYSLYKKMNPDDPNYYLSRELKGHAAAKNAFLNDYREGEVGIDLRQEMVVRLLTSHIKFPHLSKPLDVALRLNYIGQYSYLFKKSNGSEYIYLGYLYLNSGFCVAELNKWLAHNKQQKKNDNLKINAKRGGDARSVKLAVVQSKVVELLELKQASGLVWKKKTDAAKSIENELLKYIVEMNISLSTANLETTVLNWSRDIEIVRDAFALVVKKNCK
ncbi:hypothetical protein AXW37_03900 [Yersinia ruckeri]|uniref:hypothetical protein n=1 Tax=Yersinia ruckeri TaxID=29486 RepID=UPI0008FD30F7|nr:hypothetical protein [Yersinia ruckeri]MCW6524427.1 hypothetical protein [Yersinia ruckeri]MCW6604254.1 hypothetical protein [Yersinia ruckeri]MDN0090917.1 hypothetical protein [Yersinia ruckeri]OIX46956.1 hypothetical protein AXW22_03895 [Yersinia ruckeri]OJB69517.1 hypothetical protein A9Q64_03905 [Yersinia ruckeri]